MGNIESLPAALALLMRFKGMNQAELAQRSGLRPEQVSRYLTGKVVPGLRQFFALLDALEVDTPTFGFVQQQVREMQEAVESGRTEERARRDRRVLTAVLELLAAGDRTAATGTGASVLELLHDAKLLRDDTSRAMDRLADLQDRLLELLVAGGPRDGESGDGHDD